MTDCSELQIQQGASQEPDPHLAARQLYEAIGSAEAKLCVFYCSPSYDLAALGSALRNYFGDLPLIGCTTAGEISPLGYLEGSITGVSLAGDGLECASVCLEDLQHFEFARGDAFANAALQKLGGRPSGEDTFGLILVDGMSRQEEALVASLYRNLGGIQLFGGSAGDGSNFRETFVYFDGQFRSSAAVFTLVRSPYRFQIFKTEHFVAGTEKMVVTEADPANRIVTEINGEPAGREYARVVGLEVDKLTPLIFATHPVVVKIGGMLYVRSIQKVNDDESLTFFCAIDEGIVLTVADGVDFVENLQAAFDSVRRTMGEPAVVLGCDCMLRHVETQQRGIVDQVGKIFIDNHVVGFATYGEQFNGLHVNQTFTGAAIAKRRRAPGVAGHG